MRKVVFSKTLRASRWKNTELASDLATEVGRLKAEQGEEIIVYGRPTGPGAHARRAPGVDVDNRARRLREVNEAVVACPSPILRPQPSH